MLLRRDVSFQSVTVIIKCPDLVCHQPAPAHKRLSRSVSHVESPTSENKVWKRSDVVSEPASTDNPTISSETDEI